VRRNIQVIVPPTFWRRKEDQDLELAGMPQISRASAAAVVRTQLSRAAAAIMLPTINRP